MIQRKQSLFLLIAFILLIFNFFQPFVSNEQIKFTVTSLQNIASGIKIATYPIAIYIALTAFLQFFTIFLFKKRKLQMRLTILALLLSIGVYGIVLFYHFMSKPEIPLEFSMYSYSLATPMLAAIFDFMAHAGIKKDDALIKAAERFR